MAKPRNVLLMDVIGLNAGNLDHFRRLTPGLSGFTQQAALVPPYAGSTPARQATIATGTLPMHHGLIFGGMDAPMRGQPFWRRAKAKSAFFGNCPQLALASDVHLRSTRDRLYTVPEHTEAFFSYGLPKVDIGEHFERLFAHFAVRAMTGGYNFVWVENARLAIAGSVARATDKALRREVTDNFNEFLDTLFRAAKDRAVVLVSSTARRECEQGQPEPELGGLRCHDDGRLFHVTCEAAKVESVRDQLAQHPCFGRVLAGPDRAELGMDCPEAGAVVAEIRPGWGFTGQYVREPSESVGPDCPPEQFPVLLARNLDLPKQTFAMGEVAWLLQHVLSGTEYRDEA